MTVKKEEWVLALMSDLEMMKRSNASQMKKMTALFQQSERQLERAIDIVKSMEE
jgi:hypothetical protein